MVSQLVGFISLVIGIILFCALFAKCKRVKTESKEYSAIYGEKKDIPETTEKTHNSENTEITDTTPTEE